LLLLLLLLGSSYNFICCKTKMAMAMSTAATAGGGGSQCHESTRSWVNAAAIAWEQLQQNSEPAGLTSSTSTIRDGVAAAAAAAAAGGDLHCGGGGAIAAAGASCWELKDWESDITLVSFSLPAAAAVPAPSSSIACCSSCDDIITAENRSLQAAEVVSVVKTEPEIMLEPEQQQLLHATAAPEALPVLQQLGIKLLERRGVEIINDAELLQQLVSKGAGSSSRTAAAACGVESTAATSSVSINNAAAAAAPAVQLSTPPSSMTSKRQRVQLDMSSSPAAGTQNVQVPAAAAARCQVEGCTADLSSVLKEYHRRHKVCEMHSKTPNAVVGGREQRFCQQCSR
jgi:hypothetical protein